MPAFQILSHNPVRGTFPNPRSQTRKLRLTTLLWTVARAHAHPALPSWGSSWDEVRGWGPLRSRWEQRLQVQVGILCIGELRGTCAGRAARAAQAADTDSHSPGGWRAEVTVSAGLLSPWASLRGLQAATFSLWAPAVSPRCMSASLVSPFGMFLTLYYFSFLLNGLG